VAGNIVFRFASNEYELGEVTFGARKKSSEYSAGWTSNRFLMLHPRIAALIEVLQFTRPKWCIDLTCGGTFHKNVKT